MATMHEHRQHIASMQTALGRLSPDATPVQREAAVDLVLDQGDHAVEAMATELMYRLGAGDIYHPATA